MISSIIAILSLNQIGPGQNFGLNGCEQYMGVFDGSAVVRILSVNEGGIRQGSDGRQSYSSHVSLTRVQVLSGLPGVSGEKTLVETSTLLLSMFKGHVGSTFFVLAAKPKDNKIVIPSNHILGHGPHDTPTGWDGEKLDQQQADELYVALAWKTTKRQLAIGDQPYQRIVRSISESAISGEQLTRHNVATFFENTGMTNMGSTTTEPRAEDDPIVSTIRSILPTVQLSERARWQALLHRWKVPNSERPLWETLLAACDQTEGNFEVPYLAEQIKRETMLLGCTTPEQKQQRWNEILDASLRSRYPVLFVTLFRPCPKPDIGRLRAVFTKIVAMDDRDSEMCEQAFFRLANWHKDTIHVGEHRSVNGRDTWVNRAELTAYWRNVLGIP